MTDGKTGERLTAAVERIADAVEALVTIQRQRAGVGRVTTGVTMADAAQGSGSIDAPTSLGALAEPVARLAEAVSTIAATNAQLAAERRAMRKLREEEMAAVLEDVRRGRAVGAP